jgi:NADH-quinone oxidoreductase subunit K
MSVLIVVAAMLALGLYGVLTRRDVVAILASVEVMIGAGLVLVAGLGAWSAGKGVDSVHGAALLFVVLAAAEAAVGLALLVAVARRMGTTRIDELTEVKG